MFNKIWRDIRYNKQRRLLYLFITLIIVAFLYYTLSVKQYSWYVMGGGGKKDGPPVCKTPYKEMEELKSLARDIHSALDELKLTHVLIYGT